MKPPTSSDSCAIFVSVVVFEAPPEQILAVLRGLASSRLHIRACVVDNSPSNALRSVVEGCGAEYVFSGANLGYGAANNLAMQHSLDVSAYHLVCNPDIECEPAALEALFDFMEEHPDVGQVMPRILYPDGRLQRLCKRLPTPFDLFVRRFLGPLGARLFHRRYSWYELRDLDMNVPREVPNLSGCFMFLRNSVLRQTGLFDQRYFMYMEDVDLCRRVGALSRTVYLPTVSVRHGYAKGSYLNWALLSYHLRSAVRYFNKWGWVRDPSRDRLNKKTEPYEPTEANVAQIASSRADGID